MKGTRFHLSVILCVGITLKRGKLPKELDLLEFGFLRKISLSALTAPYPNLKFQRGGFNRAPI